MSASKLKDLAKLIFENRAPLPLTEEDYKDVIAKDISETFNVGLNPVLVKRIKKGTNCLKLALEFAGVETVKGILQLGVLISRQSDQTYADELNAVLDTKLDMYAKLRIVLKAAPFLVNLVLSDESQGKTALHRSCAKLDTGVVEMLLQFGADPFKIDNFKRT